jgi:hypothetical protein
MLIAAAVITCAGALVAKKRLPATSEALASIGQVIVVVDWALFRHAGVGTSLSLASWWAIGAMVSGLVGITLGSRGIMSGKILGTAGVLAALPFCFQSVDAHSLTWNGLLLAPAFLWTVIASIDVMISRLLWRNDDWRVGAKVSAIAAACAQVIALAQSVPLGIQVFDGSLVALLSLPRPFLPYSHSTCGETLQRLLRSVTF